MDRLAYWIAPFLVMCIAGAVHIVIMSLGLQGWGWFLLSGAIGLTGIPLAQHIARIIKRDDPDWPPRRRRLLRR